MIKTFFKKIFKKSKGGQEKKESLRKSIEDRNTAAESSRVVAKNQPCCEITKKNYHTEENDRELSFNGKTKFFIETSDSPSKSITDQLMNNESNANLVVSKRNYVKSDFQSRMDYIAEQIDTIAITLQIIQQTLSIEECQEINAPINKINNLLKIKASLMKTKNNEETRILLSSQIKQEVVRERDEADTNLKKELNITSNLIKQKQVEVSQAEDLFAEFEKHLINIRLHPKFEMFSFQSFVEANSIALRKKQKLIIRINLLNQIMSIKTEDISEIKIFIRGLDLWKGIVGLSKAANSISIIQSYIKQLMNKANQIEHKVLTFSVFLLRQTNFEGESK